MRRVVAGFVAVMFGLGVRSAGAQSADEVGRLSWMAGCWELKGHTRVIHEQWMAPLGGMMLGMSRTVVRDTAREFEHLRVEMRGGRASYVARLSPADQLSGAGR